MISRRDDLSVLLPRIGVHSRGDRLRPVHRARHHNPSQPACRRLCPRQSLHHHVLLLLLLHALVITTLFWQNRVRWFPLSRSSSPPYCLARSSPLRCNSSKLPLPSNPPSSRPTPIPTPPSARNSVRTNPVPSRASSPSRSGAVVDATLWWRRTWVRTCVCVLSFTPFIRSASRTTSCCEGVGGILGVGRTR